MYKRQVVDFSHPSALSSILDFCRSHPGTAAVLCTTGYSAEQTKEIQEAAKELPLFYSRNMSLGVNLLIELAKKAEAVPVSYTHLLLITSRIR